MARKSIELAAATDPAWVQGIVDNFDEFLQDHANCERKASALAISLVVKYPDRKHALPGLIALAQEELEHFGQVYAVLERRGLALIKDTPDEYVNQLLTHARHGRDERFVDRMLIASLIECRGAERFKLIADALPDPDLNAFYTTLWKAEAKHGHQFVHLLLKESSESEVTPRLEELAGIEAEIMLRSPWRAALH